MKSPRELLAALNIRYDDLNSMEQETYRQWSQTMTAPDATADDLKRFLPTYIDGLEAQLMDYTNGERKELYLKAAIRNATMVLAFLTGPEQRRKWLQQMLDQRITKTNPS